MSVKLIVTMVLLAMGFLAIIWLLLDSPDAVVDPADADIVEEAKPSAQTPIGMTIETTELIEKERIESVSKVVEEPTPAEDTTEPLETIRISGTITVKDNLGKEYTRENGSFEVTFFTDRHGGYEEVTVKDGQWFLDIRPDVTRLFFGDARIQLGDRPATLAELKEFVPVPEDGFLALYAFWPENSILRVKAADSGLELGNIELVAGLDWPKSDDTHPGKYSPDKVLLSSGQSPIDLSGLDRDDDYYEPRIYYARSPGYAWNRIEINHDLGGERILTLERCGSAKITIAGCDPNSKACLRFRPNAPNEMRPYLDLPLNKARFVTVDSLTPGEYNVSVEIGKWWSFPQVLAKEMVLLRVGQCTHLTLTLEESPSMATGILNGTLVIPKKWAFDRYYITVELLDTPLGNTPDHQTLFQGDIKPIPDLEDTYAWSFGTVQAGRYKITFRKISYSKVIEVPADGATNFKFILPPPAKVIVRVIDRSTLLDIDMSQLHWYPDLPTKETGWSPCTVHSNDQKRFEFSAPLGKIEICTGGNLHYQHSSLMLDVQPGFNEATLEVDRAYLFQVTLMDGDTNIPWDNKWDVEVKQVDGDQTSIGYGFRDAIIRFKVPQPGKYRFSIPEIQGYDPIPEQEVFVEADKTVDHVIHLRRKS